jgi:sugar phosphate isomerase/epimerase
MQNLILGIAQATLQICFFGHSNCILSWSNRDMINEINNRRFFLSGLAVAGAMAMHNGPALAAKSLVKGKGFFNRIARPIGLQMYTLGDEPAKDIDGTLAKVAAIGYRDLELPQLYGKTPAELKAAAERAKVTFSCIHLSAMPNIPATALSMMSGSQRIVDDLGVLGIKDVVLPIMLLPADFKPAAGETFQAAIARAMVEAGADTWKRTAALLNEKAAALKPHGIRVGYHNHNLEFAPVGNTTGWDILAHETDKTLVKFEIDVGWIAAAGLDPVAFLGANKGRVRWLHVKDIQATTKTNFALTMDPTEVGSGKQDWAHILPAAYRAGVEHFYLEQEAPFTMARMDSAAKGYAYLTGLKA